MLTSSHVLVSLGTTSAGPKAIESQWGSQLQELLPVMLVDLVLAAYIGIVSGWERVMKGDRREW